MNAGELAAKWRRNYRIAILYLRDGGRCSICSCHLLFELEYEKSPMFATIDHILPASKNGSNRMENFRLACRVCNQRRGNFYNKSMGGVKKDAPPKESVYKSVRGRMDLIVPKKDA